jgi:nucleotide-binding universal stress UspA family protein
MKPTFDHVLVATDFSDASSAAIDYAAILAASLGARLHLVHVLEQPFTTSGPYQWSLPDTPARREHRYHEACARLSRAAAGVGDVVTVSTEVRGGEVTQSIAQAAIDYGAGVIVLGTRGHHGFRHLFAGDSVDRLQRLARCPILTVWEPDAARAPRAPASPGLAA